ncbi:MAG: TonB-dependent receptor, partial [Bacteroidales bacterium]|nr:TonB-dependent receptor [Bacteroidales bacterium]
LFGANIIIPGTNPLIGAITDIDGKFRLEKIPVGRVNLKISYLGYNDVILSNISVNSGKELVLNIELEAKVITSKEVVISANKDKTESNNKMATVSSRMFTVEETGRYAGSWNDVSKMAANYAGVSAGSDARNDIIIRGNSPSGLLWRFEGTDIPNPNHFAAFGTTGGPVSMLNNNLLANSDFMTGAFPSEYGNAVSGVFDLKMRNGNNEKYEFLGQIGFNGCEFGAEGPISKKNGASFLINYRYSTLVLFDKLGMDFGTAGIPYYQDLSFKINLPKTKLGSFTLFGLGGKSHIDIFDSKKDTAKKTSNLIGWEGFDLSNASAVGVTGISHTLFFNKTTYSKLIIAATYHNFTTSMDSLVIVGKTKTPYYRNNFNEYKLFGSLFINKKISNHHSVRIGAIVSRMNFNLIDSAFSQSDNKFLTLTDYNGSTYLIQNYLEWQYKITDNLTFNPGIHYLYFVFNKTNSLEPRMGIKWAFAPKQTISLAYGLHSQILPVTVYFNQVRLPDGTYKRNNENMKLLQSQHFVLGYDWSISENMRLKTETYYQLISDVSVDGNNFNDFSILNQGANFGVWTPDTLKSNGTGINYGLELTLERFLNKGLYFLFTSSLYESKYKGSDDIEHNTAFAGNYAFNLLFGKEIVLKNKGKKENKSVNTFAVDLKTNYIGGQRYTPSTTYYDTLNKYYYEKYDGKRAFSLKYKDYFRVDLKITFKRNGKRATQEWAIDFSNLFDIKNILNESFDKKTGQKTYNYQIGRLIIPQYKIIF